MYCLDQDSLVQLKAYKYQSVDKSYLSYYILNPYWTWCAKFMPSWLAPNVITLIGILAIYINVICIQIYIPDLVGPGPAWLYYSCAAGLFFYQTMDNIDGKQARATGSSSPLGELFDHGVDSLNCCLSGLILSACMGMGSTRETALCAFISCVAMYASTWETYHTHTLYLGYLNGPTEGIVLVVSMMAASGIWGTGIWQTRLVDVLSVLEFFFGRNFTLKDLWVLSMFLGVILGHVLVCVYNVHEYKKKNNEPDFSSTLPQLLPIVLLSLSVYSWLTAPGSIVLSDNHIILFALTMSLVFGRVTTSIILAHLTRQPFPYWSLPMYPLFAAGVVFRLFYVFPSWVELAFLWCYFAFASTYFGVYAYRVINAICDFLSIPCFTVRKPVNLGKHA